MSSVVSKDGIPALTNPALVSPSDPDASYVGEEDRVLGLRWDDEWIALPFNVMRFHEIVNLTAGEVGLAVTYCPLTGTGIAFDRTSADGAEFGVSGLLWRNNLVMYDRSTNESLWPQMLGQAGCGEASGTVLSQVAISEMTWSAWKRLHPETRVLSQVTGHDRDYRDNPYADYEELDSSPLYEVEEDPRRPPKERVLGIPAPDGSRIAIPFGVLASEARALVSLRLPGGTIEPDSIPVVVFWDREMEAAEAYRTTPQWAEGTATPGSPTEFRLEGRRFVDDRTGSIWTMDGRAVEGPAEGSRLVEVRGSMVAFWFAWVAAFGATEVMEVLPSP